MLSRTNDEGRINSHQSRLIHQPVSESAPVSFENLDELELCVERKDPRLHIVDGSHRLLRGQASLPGDKRNEIETN